MGWFAKFRRSKLVYGVGVCVCACIRVWWTHACAVSVFVQNEAISDNCIWTENQTENCLEFYVCVRKCMWSCVFVFCGIWLGSHIARCSLALNTLASFSESSTHQRETHINESYLMRQTDTKRQITHDIRYIAWLRLILSLLNFAYATYFHCFI